MSGRPLRFLATTLTIWATLRVVAHWPDETPSAIRIAEVAASGKAVRAVAPDAADRVRAPQALRITARVAGQIRIPAGAASPAAVPIAQAPTVAVPLVTSTGSAALPPGASIATLAYQPSSDRPGRWGFSIWGIARDGRSGTLTTSQLGASQIGARATYLIDRSARLAVAGRISAPLRGRDREAALGLDWQPSAASVHVIAEQRLPLDGGASRPAVLVAGGLGPAVIGSGFRVEGYGQAGGVLRRGLFADAAVRLTKPITPTTPIHLGIGMWGGAQRNAARLDLGPTAAIVLPVAGRAIRLTLDWRHRIAGDASPGSGPALSIGGDF